MGRMKLLLAAVLGMALASCNAVTRTGKNPMLTGLEPNRWVKIHQQKPEDPVRFTRQGHGGSCFDSKRGRLILFGSNTHGEDWTNSPLCFDPVTLTWSRAYPDSDPATYAVNKAGLPVAGKNADRPWAMHTFGAVMYDPSRDEMVVACYPGHMTPGRFSNALAHVWDKVKKHPTWTYQLATGQWVPLECNPVHFFPYCAAFDTDRNVAIGHNPRGVYELSGEPRQWSHVAKNGLFGWHTNAAYDSKHKALVVFGSHRNADDIVAYRVADKSYRMMPTPGPRPPKDQHNPMAFEPNLGKTVVLIDHILERDGKRVTKAQTETWLYDLGEDAWTRVETATLPFLCGMNYNMEYDCRHGVLLLVTGENGSPTTVWALKLSEE